VDARRWTRLMSIVIAFGDVVIFYDKYMASLIANPLFPDKFHHCDLLLLLSPKYGTATARCNSMQIQ
jgi:hypothetical protein